MANNKKQPFPINYLYSFILALVFSYFSAGISVVKAEDKLTLKYSTLHRDPVNDSVIFLRDINLSDALEQTEDFQKRVQSGQPEAIALAFLQAYSTFFKLTDPARELVVKQVQRDDLGYKHVRLRQQYHGIPVQDAELIVHLNPLDHVYLLNGAYLPTPLTVNQTPELSAQQAIKRATETFKSVPDCTKCSADLVIFSLHRQPPRLVYRVYVVINIANAWRLMVDATTGEVLVKISTIQTQ